MTGSTVPPWSRTPVPRLRMGQETEKPLAGARGLRAGRGRRCPPVRCRTCGHCGPARLLPIIVANESTGGSFAQVTPVLMLRLRMRAVRVHRRPRTKPSRRPLVSSGTSCADALPGPTRSSPRCWKAIIRPSADGAARVGRPPVEADADPRPAAGAPVAQVDVVDTGVRLHAVRADVDPLDGPLAAPRRGLPRANRTSGRVVDPPCRLEPGPRLRRPRAASRR